MALSRGGVVASRSFFEGRGEKRSPAEFAITLFSYSPLFTSLLSSGEEKEALFLSFPDRGSWNVEN